MQVVIKEFLSPDRPEDAELLENARKLMASTVCITSLVSFAGARVGVE